MKKQIAILIVSVVVLICTTAVTWITNRKTVDIDDAQEVTIAASEAEDTAELTTEERATEEKRTSEKFTTELTIIDDIEELTSETATSVKPEPAETNNNVTAAAVTTQSSVTESLNYNTATTESKKPQTSTTNAVTTTQAAASVDTMQNQTTTEKEKVWHEPVTEMVWVVDREAFTESYPVYEDVCAMRCTNCGELYYTADSLNAHFYADRGDACAGAWYSDPQTVVVGTTEITYPEEGHWEPVVIQEGYWE